MLKWGMYAQWAMRSLRAKLRREDGGVDMVTILILVAIVVAVALIFREQLVNMVNTVMGNAQEAIEP